MTEERDEGVGIVVSNFKVPFARQGDLRVVLLCVVAGCFLVSVFLAGWRSDLRSSVGVDETKP